MIFTRTIAVITGVGLGVAAHAAPDSLLKKWDAAPSQEVVLSQKQGNACSLDTSKEVLSPEGNPCLELFVRKVNPDNTDLGIVLRFDYTGAPLKAGDEYEVDFRYKASAPCQATAVAALGGNPSWREFRHGRKTLSFTEEWQTAKIPFVLSGDAMPPLNLPRIMCGKCPAGVKLYFSDVTVRKISKVIALNLNPEWLVFQPAGEVDSFLGGETEYQLYSEVPKDILGASPRTVKLSGNTIDLATGSSGVRPKTCAYLYNRFESPENGVMHLGLSADWWFGVYLNGNRVYDTYASGNRSNKFTPNDHVIAIPVKKGMNILAVKLLSGSAGWKLVCGKPSAPPKNLEAFTLGEDENWRILNVPPTVDQGSVLDFSTLGFLDAPAGKYGRVMANNGHFSFAGRPEVPVRFYGTNIYGGICYQDPKGAERLASMVATYGYNAVRIHHYDGGLVCNPESGWTDLEPKKLDQLDYLVKCLKDKGVYLLLDLHSQRMGRYFKKRGMAILHEPQFRRNWERFAANLMNHVNPYTGTAWKEEPALIGICPVNENSPLFFMGNSGDISSPYFDLSEKKNEPVEIRKRLMTKFVVESQRKHFPEIRSFLRNLGVRAPLTDQNVSSTVSMALMRNACDYVDNHFYWAHPTSSREKGAKYIQSVPGESAMQSFIGARSGFYFPDAFAARLWGKPYMISEFNFCAANRYRAEGGALVGAYAAMQDWDALFRFGFAEHPGQLTREWHTVGFDTVGDPMKSLSDRLGILLFLRRDVRPAEQKLSISVPSNYTDSPSKWFSAKIGGLYSPALANWGFVSRIGSTVGKSTPFPADLEEPAEITVRRIRQYPGTDAGALDLGRQFARSTTGELTLDGGKGIFLIDTPRTAAIVSVHDVKASAGPLTANIHNGFALVSASSLDHQPLTSSGRILFFHLTNVQNLAQRFTDSTMTVMESWGKTPHVVRRGVTEVELKLAPGSVPSVYGIDLYGRRIEKIACTFNTENGLLSFTADTFALKTPCMVYEITR